jgi:hypothetical protein
MLSRFVKANLFCSLCSCPPRGSCSPVNLLSDGAISSQSTDTCHSVDDTHLWALTAFALSDHCTSGQWLAIDYHMTLIELHEWECAIFFLQEGVFSYKYNFRNGVKIIYLWSLIPRLSFHKNKIGTHHKVSSSRDDTFEWDDDHYGDIHNEEICTEQLCPWP